MCTTQQISGKGFNDMREEDVEEILAEKAVEPTNKNLDEMVKHGIRISDESQDSDVSQPMTPRIIPLTAAKISEWNSALEKIFSDMEECDPMLERSLTFKRLTSTAFVPYSEMLKDLRRKQANKAEAVFLANFRGKDAKDRTAGSQHPISLTFPLSRTCCEVE